MLEFFPQDYQVIPQGFYQFVYTYPHFGTSFQIKINAVYYSTPAAQLEVINC